MTILKPEAEYEGSEEPNPNELRDRFIREWKRNEQDFNLPPAPFGGKQYAIAAQLAKKYPLDRLRTDMVYYRRHFPLPDHTHPLDYFNLCLPQIAKEIHP